MACGRLGFENRLETDGAIDGVPDALQGDCWAVWKTGAPRFSTPVPVAELALPDKQGNPWLAPDGRTLYFDSGTGDTEIFRTTRAARDMPFGTPEQITELTSAVEDTSFSMTADNTLAVISSSRGGASGFDLFQTQRAGVGAVFDPVDATPFGNVTSSENEFDSFLTPDGLRLYYAQSAPTGQVIQTTSRQQRSDVFRLPQRLMGTGTFAVEADPKLDLHELVLVFSANIPLQLFAAVRGVSDQDFGTPFALTDLAGPGHDADPAFSPDGCELFWISDRGGDRDLYHANVIP